MKGLIERMLNWLGWYRWTIQGRFDAIGLVMLPGHSHQYGKRCWFRVRP